MCRRRLHKLEDSSQRLTIDANADGSKMVTSENENLLISPDKGDAKISSLLAGRIEGICGAIALVLAFYGLWRSRALYLAFIRDNDGHCLATLFADLASHEYSMRGWSLTPAPYFFPDMAVFFATAAAARNFATAYCLYTGILLACLFGGIYWITGGLVRSRAQRIVIVGWIALLFLLFCRFPYSRYWITAGWFLGPGGHGGGAVVGVLLIGLGIRFLQKPSAAGAAVFAAVAFLTMISDGLVLPQYLIPLLLGGLFYAARGHTRWYRPLVLLGIVGVAQLACKPALNWASHYFGFVVPPYSGALASRQVIAATWKRFVADLPLIAGITSPLTVMVLLSAVASIGVLLLQRRQRSFEIGRVPESAAIFPLLVIIALISCIASVAIPIATGFWSNFDCARYLYPVMLMPLLITAAAALIVLHAMSSRQRSVIVAAMTLVLALFWWPVLKAPAVNNSRFFYNWRMQAIDSIARKYNLHCGYASYWMIKPTNLFTRAGVVVNEILVLDEKHALARWWINNPNRWSHQPASRGGGYPIYDFAILSGSASSEFRAQWSAFFRHKCGAPAAIDERGGFAVYIYNRPSDIRFRNLFRASVMDEQSARRRITSHPSLNSIKQESYPWDGPGVQIIPPGKNLVLKFDGDGSADFMEIGVCADGTYDLEFRNRGQTIGNLKILPEPGGGIHSHQIDLVPVIGGRAFDSIVIHPAGVGTAHSIGHLVVFDDPALQPF